MPVYNSEKFLWDTFKSVLNQTYDYMEIIAVDDGSTDNSLKITNQLSLKFIINMWKTDNADDINPNIISYILKFVVTTWFLYL